MMYGLVDSIMAPAPDLGGVQLYFILPSKIELENNFCELKT